MGPVAAGACSLMMGTSMLSSASGKFTRTHQMGAPSQRRQGVHGLYLRSPLTSDALQRIPHLLLVYRKPKDMRDIRSTSQPEIHQAFSLDRLTVVRPRRPVLARVIVISRRGVHCWGGQRGEVCIEGRIAERYKWEWSWEWSRESHQKLIL
jgi:hypothetical protein